MGKRRRHAKRPGPLRFRAFELSRMSLGGQVRQSLPPKTMLRAPEPCPIV
jgi:hypothetical protein